MDITGIAKSHQADIQTTGKASSKQEWKLSDSLREKIAGYAREDAAQGVYMGNKFLALRKSEVAYQWLHRWIEVYMERNRPSWYCKTRISVNSSEPGYCTET